MSEKKAQNHDANFDAWSDYMNAKISKLQDQFDHEAQRNGIKSNIFNGVSIFVNGYTTPSASELKQLMMDYGGIYHHYQTNDTTYVVASNLPNTKIKQYKHSSIKIIKPEWVTECIKTGKLLDHKPFLLLSGASSSRISTLLQKHKQSGEIQPQAPAHNQTSADQISKPSPSKRRAPAKTATDDDFIKEFYNNSRLHHIATMGATFKSYVNELRSKGIKEFAGLKRLTETKPEKTENCEFTDSSCIMHIDMDCFFVSVGIRNYPQLRGLPVAVTHSKGKKVANSNPEIRKQELNLHKERYQEKYNLEENEKCWFENIDENESLSEVASCSYEARKCGISNGMLLGQALKLCPNLKTIPYDFSAYEEVSYTLYNHLATYTLDIEAVSCDEMYVDCTKILRAANITPLHFATTIRKEIRDLTDCPCSTGFGPNRLIARLSTKTAKPDGQFYVKPADVKDFIKKFQVSDLPGIGYSITHKLHLMGVKTCDDLQKVPLSRLQEEFGNKSGLTLHQHSLGEDDRALNFSHQRKSVSAEVNYGIRFQTQTDVENFLKKLSEEVESRLNKVGMKGKSVTLKLMIRAKHAPTETMKFLGHGVCDYITKSSTFLEATSDSSIIFRETLKIAQSVKANPEDMRGVGLQISRLESNRGHSKTSKSMDTFVIKSKREKVEVLEGDSKTADSVSTACVETPARKNFNELDYHISLSQVDPDYLEALPEDIRSEILANTRKKRTPELYEIPDGEKQSKVACGLYIIREDGIPMLNTNIPVPEIIKAVSAWVSSEKNPQDCDIDMLSKFLQQLVHKEQFEAANFILHHFQRLLQNDNRKEWKLVLSKLTERIREATDS